MLGAILLAEQALDGILIDVKLSPEDFYRERHRLVFRAMLRLKEKAVPEPIDALTVSEELTRSGELEEAGGTAYVHSLPNLVPAAGNARHYGKIVKEHALLRRLLDTTRDIQEKALAVKGQPSELVEQAEQAMYKIAHDEHASEIRSIEAVLHDELDKLEQISREGVSLIGTPSGFRDLDDITGGFQPGNLIVLAARPAMGKSALVVNIAENAAVDHDKAVALFSLEMSETELAQRFIASQAKLDGDELRKGRVKPDRWPKVIRATEALSRTQLFIDDSSDLGVMELRAKARRLHSRHNLGLIVIDYLQLMRPEDTSVGRVEQIGQMSRGLKILARELHVPVIAVSQLSRAVESRPDKRPLLSDLRESGCLTGDARVFLPETGAYARIEDLAGKSGFKVLAVNRETWRLEAREVTRAFSTGTKPVYRLRTRLGKEIRATGNHKFLTIDGWRRLDELDIGGHVAIPGFLPSQGTGTMSEPELALLGHLIGDGCTLPRHAIQYTTRERRLAELVSGLATAVFGDSVKPRIRRERRWIQVYLPSSAHLTHGKRNPIAAWLDTLGAFGHRSWEKRVPAEVFKQPADAIATFLRHLWATDGCIWLARGDENRHPAIYYATSSERLARDVQSLLLRLGITAVLRAPKTGRGRQQYHVAVMGGPDMRRFLQRVGGLGLERGQRAEAIGRWLDERGANTNRDVIPREAWASVVRPAMALAGVTTRELQETIGTRYCGSTLYKANIGRMRAERVASASGSRELMQLAYSGVYWDQVVSIEPAGVEKVYDLTVDDLHSFVANDIVVHNSIEQDADVVLFIYRDEYYNDDTEVPGEAEIIVSKHRNGPVGRINLAFMARYPKFANLWRDRGGDVPAGADANGSG